MHPMDPYVNHVLTCRSTSATVVLMPQLNRMTQLNPHPDNITPEQIIDLRSMSCAGELPPYIRDLADVALGHRFLPEERASARVKLAVAFAMTRGPLADLLTELAMWSGGRRFDDDQDPGKDSPDERVVRAYFRWQALR